MQLNEGVSYNNLSSLHCFIVMMRLLFPSSRTIIIMKKTSFIYVLLSFIMLSVIIASCRNKEQLEEKMTVHSNALKDNVLYGIYDRNILTEEKNRYIILKYELLK